MSTRVLVHATLLASALLCVAPEASGQVVFIPPVGTGGVSCADLVPAGTYGSSTDVPVVTLNADGCITAVTPTNIYARGTLTASNPFAYTATFNNAAVDFIGRSFTVTNTASGGGTWYDSIVVDGIRRWGVNASFQMYSRHGLDIDGALIYKAGTNLIFSSASPLSLDATIERSLSALHVGGYGSAPGISGDGTLDSPGSFNVHGRITATATGAISIVVTFAGPHAYEWAPSCWAINETAGTIQPVVTTTTTLTITGNATTDDKITYACIGR